MQSELISHRTSVCPCCRNHAPACTVLHRHHIKPESWGGPTEDDNLIDICPNTHYTTHDLIDLYVQLGREPSQKEIRQQLGRMPGALARDLAGRAWAERPEHPTRTLM